MEKTISHIIRPEMKDILHIQTAALKSLHDFMWQEGLVQLMPVMLSPFTDPLAHSVSDASLEYGKQKLQLTKSMILHKQLSMMRGDLKGIYIVSPNIRLEPPASHSTGRHLIEFSQVDIELREADHRKFMALMEKLYFHIAGFVRKECKDELKRLSRRLELPELPFKVFERPELEAEYGKEWEQILSDKEKAPVWVMDHYREFYDRQDPSSGKHMNYDLIYPEGFGEGLSGAERETDFDVIVKKMAERKTDPSSYRAYLDIARKGLLKPTAGGGFGVERMVRFFCGKQHIRDACLFPRIPGEEIVV